jgi:hypothetical protein
MPKQKDRYSIEALIKTFEEHAVKSEKDNEEWIRLFKETYPGEPLPPHMENDFNICRAFLTFSREIKDLKESLKSAKPPTSEACPASS